MLKLNEHTAVWNRASIRLLDIRRVVLGIDEELCAYRVPSSFFLYALRGSAEVELDGGTSSMKRFHVLHGGKGACLDIRPSAEPFEYVIVFYKAVIPLPSRQEILDLLHQHRPFQLQYRLVPHSSLALFSRIEELERSWKKGGELEHFHAKALFYQCVYELLWQLHRDGVQLARANLVSQSIRYMEEHYASSIALDALADLLECSVGHLVKLFKRETGVSPIQYLTQIRLKHAKELLLNSESTLEEIAIYVGCPINIILDGCSKNISASLLYDFGPRGDSSKKEQKIQRSGAYSPLATIAPSFIVRMIIIINTVEKRSYLCLAIKDC